MYIELSFSFSFCLLLPWIIDYMCFTIFRLEVGFCQNNLFLLSFFKLVGLFLGVRFSFHTSSNERGDFMNTHLTFYSRNKASQKQMQRAARRPSKGFMSTCFSLVTCYISQLFRTCGWWWCVLRLDEREWNEDLLCSCLFVLPAHTQEPKNYCHAIQILKRSVPMWRQRFFISSIFSFWPGEPATEPGLANASYQIWFIPDVLSSQNSSFYFVKSYLNCSVINVNLVFGMLLLFFILFSCFDATKHMKLI